MWAKVRKRRNQYKKGKMQLERYLASGIRLYKLDDVSCRVFRWRNCILTEWKWTFHNFRQFLLKYNLEILKRKSNKYVLQDAVGHHLFRKFDRVRKDLSRGALSLQIKESGSSGSCGLWQSFKVIYIADLIGNFGLKKIVSPFLFFFLLKLTNSLLENGEPETKRCHDA